MILGPLEDMQKSNSLSNKDAQKISVIHQSAIRLLNLINQILEFRKTEGLFACGEAVDVDGLCGGYNLHWAFTSGIVAGKLEAM